MKKETKRYFLIEYIGVRKMNFNTKAELDAYLEIVRKYNNRKTPDFIVGNMIAQIEDGKYVLYYHIYKKLLEKNTISVIDNYTSKFDERGLIIDLYDEILTGNEEKNNQKKSYYPDINIAYFEDKNLNERDEVIRRIKYIPVLYKEDKKYLDESYVDKCLDYHAVNCDYNFFKKMVDTYRFNRSCDDILDELNRIIDVSQNQGYDPRYMAIYAKRLYRRLIYEREKDGSIIRLSDGSYQKSRRRQRDFGFFIKNYNSTIIKSPTSYAYLNNDTKFNEMQLIREEALKRKKRLR